MDDWLSLRDVTLMCEMLGVDDPWHRPSTIITAHGPAKVAQNETELAAAMACTAVALA